MSLSGNSGPSESESESSDDDDEESDSLPDEDEDDSDSDESLSEGRTGDCVSFIAALLALMAALTEVLPAYCV